MSFTSPSGPGGFRSLAGQKLRSSSEQPGPRGRKDSSSSASQSSLSDDDELARPCANSALTASASVISEIGPNIRNLCDQSDLRVILKQTLPNGATRIYAELRCRSLILCNYSEVLKGWIKRKRLSSLDITIPRHYSTEAVDLLICSMHGRNRRIYSYKDLLHLSIACSDLKCSMGPIEALGNDSRDLWWSPEEVRRNQGNVRQDYVGWVFVALVFGWYDIFRLAWQETVMGGEAAIQDARGYLPTKLKEAIERRREKTIADIISFVGQTSDAYLDRDIPHEAKGDILVTLREHLKPFGVHLLGKKNVPSASELITHLQKLPPLPVGYRGKIPDPPLSPTLLLPPRRQSPPAPLRSHSSAGSASGGGGALGGWRISDNFGALRHKISSIKFWPSRLDVINGLPVELQGWADFRALFLASLGEKVEGFGVMKLEEFTKLREKHIFCLD